VALSLEWACGFEQFGSGPDLGQIASPWRAQLYAGGWLGITTTTGVRSLQGSGVTPKALNMGGLGGAGVLFGMPNVGTRYIAMGFYCSILPQYGESIIYQLTATPPADLGNAGTDGVRITLDNSGILRIRQNSTNAVIGASSAYAMNANTQYWLSISCNPNSGWVTIALDGTIVLTVTLGITFNLQYFGIVGYGDSTVIDDLVSYLTDGTDTANTLVPPRSVWTSLPNAVGDETQWSRIGGAVANWASVNGQAYQTTTYNTTNQTGTFDYYNTTDLPGTPTVIDGVVVTACARKEDSGERNLKLHARVDSVDDVSQAVGLTTGAAFWYLSASFTQAPGAVPWTASAVNLCQIGLESA
jgi:hypothetical protein